MTTPKTPMRILKTTALCALAAGVLVPETGRAMNGGVEITAPGVVDQTGAVKIVDQDGGRCSGTLLGDSWVLTAAHCVVPIAHKSKTWHKPPNLLPGVKLDGFVDAVTPIGGAPDRWIAAGWQTRFPDDLSPARQMLLAAIDATGAPDSSFGVDGFVRSRFAGITETELTAVAPDPAAGPARFVAVGRARDAGGADRMLVARYLATGTLDAAEWSSPGRIKQGFPTVAGVAVAAAFVPGALIVAGNVDDGTGERWQAVRYHSGGANDAGIDDAFIAFYGATTGHLRDMVAVGDRLVWLGDQNGQLVLQVTDGLGHVLGERDLSTASSEPVRLAASRADASVYVIGDRGAGEVEVARFAVPALTPVGPWPVTSAPWRDTPSTGPSQTVVEVAGAIDTPAGLVVAGTRTSPEDNPNPVLMRWTPAGARDATFGQSGVLIGDYNGFKQVGAIGLGGRDTVVVGGTDWLFDGDGDDNGRSYPWTQLYHQDAIAFSQLADPALPHIPYAHAINVGYGATSLFADNVYLHETPGVDVALVQTITSHVGGGPTTPYDRATSELLEARTGDLLCYGYGVSEQDGDADPLRRGRFELVARVGDRFVMDSTSDTTEHGDSGGGCFVERCDPTATAPHPAHCRGTTPETADDASWDLAGVLIGGVSRAQAPDGFPRERLSLMTDASVIAPWITRVTEGL
jgi:hypothetical protein